MLESAVMGEQPDHRNETVALVPDMDAPMSRNFFPVRDKIRRQALCVCRRGVVIRQIDARTIDEAAVTLQIEKIAHAGQPLLAFFITHQWAGDSVPNSVSGARLLLGSLAQNSSMATVREPTWTTI